MPSQAKPSQAKQAKPSYPHAPIRFRAGFVKGFPPIEPAFFHFVYSLSVGSSGTTNTSDQTNS